MNTPDLFTPVRLGAIEAPNRIVMAPLTRMRAEPGTMALAGLGGLCCLLFRRRK